MNNRPLIYRIQGYRIDTNDILLINPREDFMKDMMRNPKRLPENPKLKLYITNKYIDTHIINDMSIASSYIFIVLKNTIRSIMNLEEVKSLTVTVYTDSITFKNIRRNIISAVNTIRKEMGKYYNYNKRFGITYINRFDDFSIGDTRYTIHSNGKVTVYEKNAYKENTLINSVDLPILYKNNQFDIQEYLKYLYNTNKIFAENNIANLIMGLKDEPNK